MGVSKKPEERKNEILDNAEMLFITKGYSKTTINDILTAVGIAKGTFYYYFKSKEEVMDAIVLRFIDIEMGAIKLISSDQSLNASEKIFKIIIRQSPESDKKEKMIEQFHQIDNAEMHQKSLVQTILQLTPVLTDIVEQGIKEKVFKTDYPTEVVEFFLVSSQILFDDGIFQWKPSEIIQKSKALAHIMEITLGAKSGTFDYIAKKYKQEISE